MTTPTPTDLPEALIDDLEFAVLGATKTGNTAVVHQARKALLAALTASAQAEAVDKESLTVAQPQAGAESYPAEPTPDELRAIAREARNSSGSASDDCGPAAYVLHGWRAATAALRARGAVPSDVVTEDATTLQRRAFTKGWDERGMTHEIKSGIETDDRMRALLDVFYPRAAAPQPPAALPGEQDAAHWPQLRSALAMFLLGWAGRHPEEQTMGAACTSLDSVTKPGSPLAVLRSAPDWRDHMSAKGRTDGGA